MKVLMVSFYFPPLNAVGGLRAGKLAKYLPAFGCEPWVLTVAPDPAGDLTAECEVPEERVTRVAYQPLRLRPGVTSGPAPEAHPVDARRRPLCLRDIRNPDQTLGWYRNAVRAGRELLERESFDVLFSSFGPPSSHMVARALQQASGLPWIAEYRDLWTGNYGQPRGRLGNWIDGALEGWTMRAATRMITVSQPLADTLRARHGRPVDVIPNGYDEADYPRVSAPATGDVFRLVYTGRIYQGRQSPAPLFDAMRRLAGEGLITPDRFEVVFVGEPLDDVADLARSHGVDAFVRVRRPVPHPVSRQMQIEATALLVLGFMDPTLKGVLTGKVFEYLGAKRPILAIAPGGDILESLLKETRAGVTHDRAGDIAQLLKSWISDWERNGRIRYEPDETALSRYTRRVQAGRLADIIRETVSATAG